jgi:nucleotide-binding universal stress UspA family protein
MAFQRILIGVDGSRGGESATTIGGEMAAAMDAAVVLVHAVPLPPAVLGIDQAISDESIKWLEESALRAVDAAGAILDALGVPHESIIRPGGAADVILDVADEQEADLIVVGHRGLGPVRRIFLGSVSSKIAHHARCAVLLAPVKEGDE